MFSTKGMTVLAAIAAAIFLLLIGLQTWELKSYSAPPSVWPAAGR